MPETSVRLSEEHRDLIQDVADQLDTSIKSVVGMILQWFFDTDWGNPDVIARLAVDDDEDENEEKDEEEDEDEEPGFWEQAFPGLDEEEEG